MATHGANQWYVRKYNKQLATAQTVATFDDLAGLQPADSYVLDDLATLYPYASLVSYQITHFFTNVYVSAGKTINLSLLNDDSVRIMVNGTSQVVEPANNTTAKAYTITLSAGWNYIDVLFYEHTGGEKLDIGVKLSTLVDEMRYMRYTDEMSNMDATIKQYRSGVELIMAVASGQISIVDYTDAPSVSAFITSTQPKTQVFDPNNSSYAPNWGTTNPVLTPALFVSSDATNSDKITQAKSIKWFDMDAPTTELTSTGNYAIAAVSSKGALTIKANILSTSVTSKTYICQVVYTDPTSGFDLMVRAEFTFALVKNGAVGADAVVVTAWSPQGNLFKNNAGTSLTAQVDLYKGSTLTTSGVTYEWFVQSSGNADEGAGLGWKKITSANKASLGVSGTETSATITISPDAVLNVTSFKAKVKYNNVYYYDTTTFIDQTDPIQVTVQSTNGDIFKNGNIATTLKAILYQNGAEIDTDGTKYTYKWFRFNKDQVQDTGFGGTGINFKSGKSIDITNAHVAQRATFVVEIS